jgi:hypothetical protein
MNPKNFFAELKRCNAASRCCEITFKSASFASLVIISS